MNASELQKTLTWRYATKKFDADKHISKEDWQALEQALVLSPSSFGLQPWKFLVVNDPVLREQLLPHSWNQPQVNEASHLVVFATQRSVTPTDVDAFLNLTATTRQADPDSLAAYRQMIDGFLSSMNPAQMLAWTTRQTYIALGQFMTSAAVLGIDTCPLEGINPAEYDRALGLEDSRHSTVVACAAGYRHPDDKYATLPKVRFPASQVIEHLD